MSSFISIHAPTWGATRKHFRKCHYHHISIHAPTWGATNSISMVLQISTNFNPRTHVGCDLTLFLIPIFLVNFNPRTHVGCDSGGHLLTCPTPHFNPRTHVGCDVAITAGLSATRISIHAPTWGATRPLYFLHSVTTISIHAPTWGATRGYFAFT